MANPESNWYSWQCFAWVLNESGKAVSWKSPEGRQTCLLEFQLGIVLLLHGVFGKARDMGMHTRNGWRKLSAQNDEINLLVAGNSDGKPRIQLILLTILAWVLNESGKAVSWKIPESRQTFLLEFQLRIVLLLCGVWAPEWWNQLTGSWKQQWQTQNPIDTPDNSCLSVEWIG